MRSPHHVSGIGRLLVEARKGGKLIYVGSVGTGIKDSEAWKLRAIMDKLKTARAPVAHAGRRKEITRLKPKLIAEIEYRAWTGDGKLWHASYKGLREEQDDVSVCEQPREVSMR